MLWSNCKLLSRNYVGTMEDFLTLTSLDFLNISSDISALWAHGSISLDLNKANGMLAGNATRIFCNRSSAIMSHALEQIKLLE